MGCPAVWRGVGTGRPNDWKLRGQLRDSSRADCRRRYGREPSIFGPVNKLYADQWRLGAVGNRRRSPVGLVAGKGMTAIFKGELEAATARRDELNAKGLHACLSGCKASGYEVLVRAEIVGACKEIGRLPDGTSETK